MGEIDGLKICFLVGTLGRGGAERQLLYMLRALRETGARVRVLCLTRGEPFEDEIKELGVAVEWVGASRFRPVRLLQIVRALARSRPDIVQSTHFYTNLYAAAAARCVRAISIGAIRSNLTSELRANGAAGRFHLRSPAHLVANSTVARQRALALGIKPERIHLVSNAVEAGASEFAVGGVKGGAVRVLFVGRLTAEKRPDRFLRVVASAAERCSTRSVKAVIAGEGPLKVGLASLASKFGLEKSQLELLGECKDMGRVYRACDFVMLTSDWEGTPNVLLEAMSYGLPVAATRVGGVPEIVRADRGFVVEPGDDEGLTAAALKLIDDAELRARLGRSGREYVARCHSLDALRAQLVGTYRKVITR